METKKSQKADLKSKQLLFLEIGLVAALGIVFSAFQWSVEEKNMMVLNGTSEVEFEPNLIPITRPEKPKVKEVPAVKALKLDIVENIIDIEKEIEIFNIDWEPDIAVAPIIFDEEDEVVEEKIFVHAEQMPEFPGGEKALIRFLATETKYPELAKMNGIKGKVFVGFVINSKGFVEQARILRPVDELLEKEALRVVNKMPKWKAGKQRGKAVNVAYTVPINFQLN